MLWIGDHYFQDAKTKGWFDAILVQVFEWRLYPVGCRRRILRSSTR